MFGAFGLLYSGVSPCVYSGVLLTRTRRAVNEETKLDEMRCCCCGEVIHKDRTIYKRITNTVALFADTCKMSCAYTIAGVILKARRGEYEDRT